MNSDLKALYFIYIYSSDEVLQDTDMVNSMLLLLVNHYKSLGTIERNIVSTVDIVGQYKYET